MLTVTLPLAEGAGVIGCQEQSIVGFCDRYCWLVQCLFSVTSLFACPTSFFVVCCCFVLLSVLCERHCLLVQCVCFL